MGLLEVSSCYIIDGPNSIPKYIFSKNALFYLIICREQGAKLPIILDAKNQRKLLKKRKKSIGRRRIWLGGIFSNGSYLWDNDAKSLVSDGFQAWLPGQPDNFRNNEECLMMNPKGRWNDVTCDSKGYVMCEKCTNCESPLAIQPLSCPNNCSGEGLCDSATGQCLCNSGRKGADCSSKNYRSSPHFVIFGSKE